MGSPVNVLDKYYLAITLLVTVGYQLTGFAIAWTFQFDKITDFTGGSNFFILALLTLLLGQEFNIRNVLASVFVMVWAARLAGFLLYRVLKMGSDSRFDDIRSHFFKFFAFWVGQILWVWIVSLPVVILNSPGVSSGQPPAFGTASDILGVIIWVVGWVVETIADWQKFQYKASDPPKEKPTNVGLWGWSRHPPYFGEIMCWWGIWTLTVAPALGGVHSSDARSAQLGSLVSPLLTMLLLLFASGVPTAEKPTAQKFYKMAYPDDGSDDGHDYHERQPANGAWVNYQTYRAQTSILVPLPPTMYRALPMWIKRTFLLELPMYEWTPGTTS
ncbi:DUF1295-domain-containing protein [Lentinus tigrinus ALCF2SS1-6]|uniref:DUF1295-domain-containing protein n=1 Tax=Lentinus tigrinus ALCF2SS1-6 TaxID=1328759 RepID=A0A5C2RY90_9APHY|nr:DUF1295-domain-containing protein [Lentinus tigrinus ALCF2SS1-6]